MPRQDVVGYLGAAWPAQPGETVERVGFLSAVAHGALSVQTDGPGITWWVVDGVMVPQDAGPLPRLEGDEMYAIPAEEPETPPTGPPSTFAADTPTT
jgi:hypothetical protein